MWSNLFNLCSRELTEHSCCVGGLCFCGGKKTQVHYVCSVLIVRVGRWLGIFLWGRAYIILWLELLYGKCNERMCQEIKVFNVVFFEGPDMLAEFSGVSLFSVVEWCSVVSVSCFEVVLCESDERFCHVVVFVCSSGLVDYLHRMVMGSFR